MSHKYRYVATAALAVVLAAGAAACGTDSEPQLRSEGASVQQNAGTSSRPAATPLGLPASRKPTTRRPSRPPLGLPASRGSPDRTVTSTWPPPRPARTARIAEAAGSDRHLDSLASEAAQVEARVAHAAGSDRHLQNLADEVEGAASVIRMPIYRFVTGRRFCQLPVLGGFSDRGCQRTRPVARPGPDRR